MSVRCALCAVRLALCDLRCALCAVRYAQCGMRCAPCAVRHALCAMRCALCVVRYALCAHLNPLPREKVQDVTVHNDTPLAQARDTYQ